MMDTAKVGRREGGDGRGKQPLLQFSLPLWRLSAAAAAAAGQTSGAGVDRGAEGLEWENGLRDEATARFRRDAPY